MECIKIVAVWMMSFFTMVASILMFVAIIIRYLHWLHIEVCSNNLSQQLYYTRSQPGGSVLVRLDHLQNPENTDHAGKCCGKRLRRCQPCDYQLSIWVTCDGRTTGSHCLYGVGKTRIFYNKSEIFFLQDLGNGSRNPLVSNFTSFQGNLAINILATNAHGSKIHSYLFHQSIHPAPYGKKRWINTTLNANGNSNLTLSYNIYCKEHYYAPSCSVGCLPGANYKCDENTGKRSCFNGYIGPNCTCKPAGHKYNCDTTGKRICYSPWHGVKCDVKCQERNDGLGGYNCDTKTGAKICLIGWYGSECNYTTPQVSSSVLLTPQVSSSVLLTPRVSSSVLLIPQVSSSVLLTPQVSSSVLLTPQVSSSLLLTPTQKVSVHLSINYGSTMVASNFHSTLSTTRGKSKTLLTTKNSVHHTTSLSKKMMSSPKITAITLMTSSPQMSSLMTSALMALPSTASSLMMPSSVTPLPITSLMTSSTMTSSLMTSSSTTSHLFPSHAYPVLTEGGMSQPKRTSMTTRNFTRQTETTIVTTSYVVKLKPLSLHIDFTDITERTIAGTSMDFTATSEGKRYQTEVAGSRTTDLLAGQEITRNKHKTDSSGTCCDVTSTPTPRDTTFKPESKDARKGDDLWWLLTLPIIVAILLIVTGIAVFKKKNRTRREITPHYEASMQQFEVKPEESIKSNEADKQHARDILNNNKESCHEDLEAIWKAMSTFHE